MESPAAVPTGKGAYQVSTNGRVQTVYVASDGAGWWAFMDGQVFRGGAAETAAPARGRGRRAGATAAQALTAPMPATVLRVLVSPGVRVAKGDTVVVLEAMKMELPLRAAGDATVQAVHCREGDLVQPDSPLVDLA